MGRILIITEGLETNLIPEDLREPAILDFFDMKRQAEAQGYKFMIEASVYEHTYSYGTFYSGFVNLSYENLRAIPSLKGVSQTVVQMFQNYMMQCPNPYVYSDDFQELKPPRALSGFKNECCKCSDYIFDERTFLEWENAWFSYNPDMIDWPKDNNEFMPRLDLTERILLREYDYHKGNNEVKILKQRRYSTTHIFHEGIVAHKGNEKIAYFMELANEVLRANYYKYEALLSKMESEHMGKPRKIYSLKTKSGKVHFVSLDFAHGMLEICDDKGGHIGEFRIDGTFNSVATPVTHSLRCIDDWLRQKI